MPDAWRATLTLVADLRRASEPAVGAPQRWCQTWPEQDWYRDEADLRRGAPALNSSRASALRLLDDATPEPSTWAMMLISFIGLGYAGFRRARKSSRFA